MENNEFEVIELEAEETEEKGLGTGLAMAIGALITAGTIAGIKGAKKFLAHRKAKKELEVSDDDDFDDIEIVEDDEKLDEK